MKRLLAVALLAASAAWGAEEADGHHGPDLTVWKVANFALLVVGLGYLLKKKGGPFFAERTRQIRRGIDDAARMKADAEARAAEIERRMAALGEEIEGLRRAAREEMTAERERLRAETGEQVAKIQAQARREIASAAKAARQQLREHAAGLALRLAERNVRARMTPETQDQLLGAFARELAGQAERRPPAGVN